MSLSSLVPPTLLDYTLLRLRFISQSCPHSIYASRSPSNVVLKARSLHSAAAPVMNPPPLPQVHHLPTGRNSFRSEEPSPSFRGVPSQILDADIAGPLSELAKRVQELKDTASAEESVSEPLAFTEDELMTIYQDLLDVKSLTQPEELLAETSEQEKDDIFAEQDKQTINLVDQRLLSAPFLQSQDEVAINIPREDQLEIEYTSQPYQRVLSNAHGILSRMEEMRKIFEAGQGEKGTAIFPPVSILTIKECETLVRVALRAQDGRAAESALRVMKRSNMTIPPDLVTQAMELYARSGQILEVEHLLRVYLTELPTDRQRHLHIKAHLRATLPGALPIKALELLHSYENQALPAPIPTYTTLITTLFSAQSSVARAHAWDLFTHMRYVAHAKPDIALYTLMIRACASPVSNRKSEPERALDLWHEMTVDQRMTPTVGAYDAIILACARSGNRAYVNEGFRLAKEMLDSHRDASGWSAYRPDRRTFCALLEGAKRIGDLARARWILAEMARNRNEAGEALEANMEIDEEVMMHVFHAYASYLPPFERRATQLINTSQRSASESSPALTLDDAPAIPVNLPPDPDLQPRESPSFSAIPPQSKAEVIAEVQALFDRMIEDTVVEIGAPIQDEIFDGHRLFQSVQLTTRLINSYLSVFYKHSSLETCKELFWKLFDDLEVKRSARTYVEALERCANARKGYERTVASQFSNELWAAWQKLESNMQTIPHARLVERAHIARIRTLALIQDLEGALSHVRAFVAQYPPAAVRQISPKSSISSTRTVLTANRPLIRMTGTSEIPDDRVPPLLTFSDLEVLHHRLVAAGDEEDAIGYLKYISKSYEWALRVRRDETLKAEPEK